MDILFRLTILTSFITSAAYAMTVKTTIRDRLLLSPGTPAEFDCTIAGYQQFNAEIRFPYKGVFEIILRQYGPDRTYDSPVLPGSGMIVSPASDHYVIVEQIANMQGPYYVDTTADTGKVHVKIPSVSMALNGTYICRIKKSDGTVLSQAKIDLFVKESPSIPRILYQEAGKNQVGEASNTIVLQQNTPGNLTCSVQGGNPTPSISVYLGAVDISHKFTTHTSNVIGLGPKTDFKRTFKYETGRSCNRCQFKVEDSGTLECRAASGSDPPTINTKYLSISTKPVISCPVNWEIENGEKDVLISCSVMANPQIISTKWQLQKGNSTLTEGIDYPTYDLFSKAESKIHFKVNLKIHEVTKEHFGKINVRVVNDVGATDMAINLQQKPSSGRSKGPNHGNRLAVEPMLLLLGVLAMMLNRY
ncbi:uncharacterized protein LOC141911683 [Tubulanus polymorphus]|uniref:uncharacterized protein LOC141911683 n=1 Tax=Tubulanus polymorphus TaxID=672921 RepID=UPI003DA5451D